jgi:predicted dehydrogenase
MGRHHARVYAQIPEVEFVGAVDHDPERSAGIVSEWGGASFGTVDELIDAGVDAVTIATPTITHRALAEQLLGAGVHCMIEKPLAPDSENAAAITDAAHRAERVIQVGHVVRYDPVMRAIREIEGLRPRFIEMLRVSPMTFRSIDVGVVLDMMIHDLDLLMMLIGVEPEEIHANAVSVLGEAEDVCNARLVFPADEDGIRSVANVTASRLAFKTERKLRIISEDTYVAADFGERSGTVVHKTANQEQLDEVRNQLRDGKDLSDVDYLSLVNTEPLQVGDGEPLRLQAEAFLYAIRTGERPEVDAAAGSAAVRTAERIVEAARLAGARMV